MRGALIVLAMAGGQVLATNLPGVLTLSGLLIGSVAFAITAIFRGWLIPKSSHERELDVLKQQLVQVTALLNQRVTDVTAERETWRSVAREFEAVNAEVRSQNRMMLEQGKTSTYAIDQIRRALDQISAVIAAGARPGDVASIRSALDDIRAAGHAAGPGPEGVTT